MPRHHLAVVAGVLVGEMGVDEVVVGQPHDAAWFGKSMLKVHRPAGVNDDATFVLDEKRVSGSASKRRSPHSSPSWLKNFRTAEGCGFMGKGKSTFRSVNQ
jgi:hypothetical protein